MIVELVGLEQESAARTFEQVLAENRMLRMQLADMGRCVRVAQVALDEALSAGGGAVSPPGA